jgi:hypothetical protein
MQLIPGLDSAYYVAGWTPDGASVYMASTKDSERVAKVYKTNIATGKMETWKNFGAESNAGAEGVGGLVLSSDESAYAYVYDRVLSEAYVVTGLR